VSRADASERRWSESGDGRPGATSAKDAIGIVGSGPLTPSISRAPKRVGCMRQAGTFASLVVLVASPGSSCLAGTRCRGDLSRVLLGVLTDPPGEKLDGHDAERRMPTLARPVGVGQCLEQPCELLVLGHDCVQEISDRLTAGQAGATITVSSKSAKTGASS